MNIPLNSSNYKNARMSINELLINGLNKKTNKKVPLNKNNKKKIIQSQLKPSPSRKANQNIQKNDVLI